MSKTKGIKGMKGTKEEPEEVPRRIRVIPKFTTSMSEQMESLPLSEDLLQHYRDRIREFEVDQAKMLDLLQSVEVSREEQHQKEWELQKRCQEIDELQTVLSDTQILLIEEQRRALELKEENEKLKIRQIKDHKDIAYLLDQLDALESLACSGSSSAPSLTFVHERRPKKMKAAENPLDDVLPKKFSSETKVEPTTHAAGKGDGRTIDNGKRTLHRKVILPSDEAEELALTIESLQAMIVAHKASEQKRVGALLKDREVRMEEEGLRAQRDGKRIEHMQKEIERLHRSLFQLTKEHMEFRQNMRNSARVAREMHEGAIQERDEAKKELQSVVRSMEDERRMVVRTAERQGQQIVQMLRDEGKEMREELQKAKAVHQLVEEEHGTRLARTEEAYNALKQRFIRLETRRRNELEGFETDVKFLKKGFQKLFLKVFNLRTDHADLENAEFFDHDSPRFQRRRKEMLKNYRNLKERLENVARDLIRSRTEQE